MSLSTYAWILCRPYRPRLKLSQIILHVTDTSMLLSKYSQSNSKTNTSKCQNEQLQLKATSLKKMNSQRLTNQTTVLNNKEIHICTFTACCTNSNLKKVNVTILNQKVDPAQHKIVHCFSELEIR